ncbi:MAG: hypothetical protein ACOYMR_17540, partial [Ilumatobacteraceae bacterium]
MDSSDFDTAAPPSPDTSPASEPMGGAATADTGVAHGEPAGDTNGETHGETTGDGTEAIDDPTVRPAA